MIAALTQAHGRGKETRIENVIQLPRTPKNGAQESARMAAWRLTAAHSRAGRAESTGDHDAYLLRTKEVLFKLMHIYKILVNTLYDLSFQYLAKLGEPVYLPI
jgi:hypothetical protein